VFGVQTPNTASMYLADLASAVAETQVAQQKRTEAGVYLSVETLSDTVGFAEM